MTRLRGNRHTVVTVLSRLLRRVAAARQDVAHDLLAPLVRAAPDGRRVQARVVVLDRGAGGFAQGAGGLDARRRVADAAAGAVHRADGPEAPSVAAPGVVVQAPLEARVPVRRDGREATVGDRDLHAGGAVARLAARGGLAANDRLARRVGAAGPEEGVGREAVVLPGGGHEEAQRGVFHGRHDAGVGPGDLAAAVVLAAHPLLTGGEGAARPVGRDEARVVDRGGIGAGRSVGLRCSGVAVVRPLL